MVLAKFVPEAITLPQDRTEMTLAEAREAPAVLAHAELGAELASEGVVTIRRLVSDFDPKIIDRHGNPVTNADGEVLTVPHDLRLWHELELTHDRVEESCQSLIENPDIEVAEPNWRRSVCSLPNDDYFDCQWGLRNTGQYGGVPGKDLNAEEAWDEYGTGIYPTRVAVLDTGMDFDHPDFHAIEDGANFISGGLPEDDNIGPWHGTAVSGIIGMKGDNEDGGTGVGWQLTIVPVKVLNWAGYGSDSDIAAALDWTRSQGIKIANMSLGGGEYSSLLCEAVRNNRAAGMTNIAAAGNDDSSDAFYPAGYSRHCLSVNAFMMNGDRWDDHEGALINLLCGLLDSPYGSNYGSTLDLTAPGGRGIFTTKHSVYDDGYYEVTAPWHSCAGGGITDWTLIDAFGGTSAAAPYVSGAAGLIMAMNPDLDGEDAEQILIRRAHDHDQYELGWDEESGWGRPDLAAALELTCSPYVAERVTGISGGNAVSDGEGLAQFWNVDGLANGMYIFQRYRVDKTMALETSYVAQPMAWGRAQGAIGWPRINDDGLFNLTNEDVGTTSIAAVSNSSITVRTYYYDLFGIYGGYIGRFPDNESVRFSFTAIGPVPTVGIEDVAAARSRVLRVTPNPASSWAAIRLPFLDRELSSRTELSILDASGRQVRRFAIGGTRNLVWDLTSETGSSVATGMYFLRLVEGERSLATERLLVIR